MEFTQKQMSEIISTIANGQEGFQELIREGKESLMKVYLIIYQIS